MNLTVLNFEITENVAAIKMNNPPPVELIKLFYRLL